MFCEFYEVKLVSRTQVLRHKYLETAVISTGSMTAIALLSCATVKAVFEPVETTVDVLSSPNLQGFNCNLKPFPKPFEDIARVFAVFVSAANKNASRASKRKLVSKPKACDVDALPAFNKYAKTAVDGLPAFNKHPKTAVDAFPALNKYEKTAVDGLSSLVERTKTAVDGILSRRGRVTTAVAALFCGFSARFALGYSITQKIKEYSV